jgi:hypothetical protein
LTDRNGYPPTRDGDEPDCNGRNPRSVWGASEEEMGLLAGIDADAEYLVRGEPPRGADPELVELAALMRELGTTYARPPAEAVGEQHLAAIVAEAAAVSAGSAVAVGRDGAQAVTRIPPARRGRTHAFRLAAAGLATLLAATGLAVAGVKPPAPVDDVLQRIGIGGEEAAKPSGGGSEVPSRGEASETPASNDARRDGAARTGGGGGEARGGDRSRSGARGAGQGEPGAEARGDERKSATGTINSAPGRATADEARTGQTPPQSPGRSGDHAPETAGPPATPGSPGAAQGRAPRLEGKSDFGLGGAAEAHDRGGGQR